MTISHNALLLIGGGCDDLLTLLCDSEADDVIVL